MKLTTNNVDAFIKSLNQLKSQYEALSSSSTKATTAMSENAQKNVNEQSKKVEQIAKKMGALRKKLASESGLGEDTNFSEKGLTSRKLGLSGDNAESYDKDRAALKRLESSYGEAQAKLKEFNDDLEKSKQSSQIFTQGAEAAKKGVESLGNEVDEANGQIQKFKAEELADKIRSTAEQFVGFYAILRAGRAAVQDAISTYSSLDESYTSIAAVTGRTRKQMWELNDGFNEMAQRLGTTTKNIAEASKLYFQQGRSQSEVMDLVEQTTILATVAEIDFTSATNYMTAAINGYNIAAEDAVTITDTWSELAAISAVDVNELAVAISKVASLAGSVGVDMETTSAFLSKMIETTREAPENLGTALKTVIARFSELKESEDELDDGGSANRVEKALASVGVQLRDTAGQFRDFDDVILDLSKKWDSLSVNQQRYIATQAAGSRQQSRFIALVEDYDRNIELINAAHDSAGSSAQQFEIQLSGINASINKLKSAWEGLYTSLEQGPTLFSGLINALASIVSSLADLGVGGTTAAAVIIALTLKMTLFSASTALANAQLEKKIKTDFTEVVSLKTLKIALKETAKEMGNVAITTARAVGPYIAIAAAITAVVGGLIWLITKEERDTKALQESIQAHENAANTYSKHAKSIEELRKEYNELYEAGLDVTDVSQQLIDKYKDEIPGIENLVGNYTELNRVIDDYIKKQEKAAALEAISAYNDKKEQAQKGYEDALEKFTGYQNKSEGGYSVDMTMGENGKEYNIWGPKGFLGHADSAEKAYETLKKYGVELEAVEDATLGLADATLIATNMSNDFEEEVNAGLLQAFTNLTGAELNDATGQFDDEQIQSQFEGFNSALNDALENLSEEDQQAMNDFLNKDFTNLTREQVDKFTQILSGLYGELSENLASSLWQEALNSNDSLNKALGKYVNTDVLDKLTTKQKTDLATKMKDMTEEGKDQVAKYYNAISQVSGEIDGIKIADLGMEIDASDSNALFDFLLKIQEEAPQATDAIRAVSNAINEMDIDITGKFSGIGESLQSDLDQIENAYSSGLESLSKVEDLIQASNGALSADDFYIDASGKYKLYEESAKNAALAVQELKKQEFERTANATLNLLGVNVQLTESNREYVASLLRQKIASIDLTNAELQLPSVQAALAKNNIVLSATTLDLARTQLQAELAFLQAKGAAEGLSDAEATQAYEYQKAIDALNEKISSVSAYEDLADAIEITGNQFYDTSLATDRFKDASSNTKDAVDSLTDSLNKEKEALEKLRDTTKDSASTLYDAMKDRLEAELDYYQNAVSNYYDALDQALEELIDKAQDGLDELNDKADKLSSIAEENGDDLQSIADAVIGYYDSEINAIQAKIDALNDEADATEKLQKLQEARDAYEKAKQKTRLVLTNGGGWRFKTDAAALEEAGSELASAEQEHQVDLLQQQIDALEQIKSQWEEIAKGIGKATSEIEKEANFQAYLNGLNQDQLNSLKNQFGQQVGINNVLNEQALQAQNKYEQENNASAQGTLAWQISQWQNAQQQAQQDQNQFDILTDPNAKAVADLKAQLLQQLGDAGEMSINQALQSGLNIITDSAEKVNAINSALEKLEQLMDTIDMTSAEIRDYNSIISEVNSASLDSLLEDGTTYNQLLSQWEETIALNDKISDLQARIDEIEGSEDGETNTGTVAAKTSSLAANVGGGDAGSGEDTVYGQNQVQNTNLESLIDRVKLILSNLQVFEAGQSMESYISRIVATIELVIDAVNSIEPRVGGESASGGLVDSTGLWAVHGTQTHPEMMLNANQSAKLFQWIDSLPNHLPSYSIPSFASGISSRGQTQKEESPQFMNCDFNINSSADSLDDLIADIKRKVPLR